jgi:histidinol-phosphatase
MSPSSDPDVAEDLDLALRLAGEASALALDAFERGTTSSQKADGTPVTETDVAVERLLSGALAVERPDDAVLGEELGGARLARRRWILDPIDGTMNFIAGREDWGVHVALEIDGEMAVGVVTRPARAARWWAARGHGAFVGDLGGDDQATALRVSGQATLAGARLSAWLLDGDQRADRLRGHGGWEEPVDLDTIFRIADGTLDGFVDGTGSRIWDRAPFIVLIEEAGGRYYDRNGGRHLELAGGIFTNGLVDGELARYLDLP